MRVSVFFVHFIDVRHPPRAFRHPPRKRRIQKKYEGESYLEPRHTVFSMLLSLNPLLTQRMTIEKNTENISTISI